MHCYLPTPQTQDKTRRPERQTGEPRGGTETDPDWNAKRTNANFPSPRAYQSTGSPDLPIPRPRPNNRAQGMKPPRRAATYATISGKASLPLSEKKNEGLSPTPSPQPP